MPLRVRVPVGEKSIDVYFIFGSLEVTGPKKSIKVWYSNVQSPVILSQIQRLHGYKDPHA